MAYVVNRYVQNIMAAIENTDLWDEPKIFSMPLLDSDSLTTFNAASVGTESLSGTLMRYNSDPNQDKWPIWQACILGASEYTLSSWLYVHLLGMSVGETLWFYNYRFGRANAIGFKKTTTSAGGTVVAADIIVRVSSTNYSYAATVAIGGTDSSSRDRQFAFTAITDNDNHYAIPIYFYGYRRDPMQTGDNVRPQMNAFTSAAWLSVRTGIYTLFSDIYVPPAPSSDPYAPGGTSEPSEPTGTFTPTEDDVEPPSTPLFNLGISHLLTAYVCDLNEINAFADYMWANAASLAGIDKVIFGNVADCVLSVHMLPLDVPHEATASTVTVGNYPTSVQLKRATVQFVDVDCGSVNLAPFWASYLDFNPLCKMTLVLPYIGEVSLDPDEVMQEQGGVARTTSLSVLYRVDILTGSLVAYVTATRLKADGSTQYKVLIGQYAGTCSLSVPVTQADFTQVKNALMQAAVTTISLAATAASGGLTAPEAIGAAGSAVVSTANNIGNGKLRIAHSGGLAGSAGFMGYQTPYLIIKRAKQSLPEGYNAYRGYPLNVTKRIGDLEGFTAVSDVILDGIPLTDEELSELRTLLQGGVYL